MLIRTQRKLTMIAAIFAGLSACGSPHNAANQEASSIKEGWNGANDPLRLNGRYVRTLSQLPQSGQLGYKPWSDAYWAGNQGGIAKRWRMNIDQFNYRSPNRSELFSMSSANIALLSPAEKYDILVGRYDYPLVRSERARTSPSNANWIGLCHGWAAAAINFDEPNPVVMQNADGVQIPFGSSDVKALLTLYQGNIGRSNLRSLGSRCDIDIGTYPAYAMNPECRDINAGAFHVALTNQIGLAGRSLIVDIARGYQIWNQPVYAFSSRVTGYSYPSSGAAPGTVREASIVTRMIYTNEVSPNWYALNGSNARADAARDYAYRVELNGADQIIGGTWETYEHPDFVWLHARPAFTGYFASLSNLYEASRGAGYRREPTP